MVYFLLFSDASKCSRPLFSSGLSDHDIPREDPDLVRTVRDLGKKANDQFAELHIVEIPDGVLWEIEEYDGIEHIAEQHRTWS